MCPSRTRGGSAETQMHHEALMTYRSIPCSMVYSIPAYSAKRKDEVAKIKVEVGIIREGKDKDKGSGTSCPNWERGEGNLDKIQKNSYFFRETSLKTHTIR